MFRNIRKIKSLQIIGLGMLLTIAACALKTKVTGEAGQGDGTVDKLQYRFSNIPDSVQTSIYWYWMSDNMSVDGVEKDLDAMKKVGINRVFIGNIWQDAVAAGKVKIFSDAWWKVLHAALKKATALNIEVGIFNSPGWSQSGGPWIEPGQSMRYLSSSEKILLGAGRQKLVLPKPHPEFQDVRVIAYPVSDLYFRDLSTLHPVIFAQPEMKDVHNAFDNDEVTGIQIKRQQTINISLLTKEAYKASSIIIIPKSPTLKLKGELKAEIGGKLEIIKSFLIDRSNNMLSVGFSPKSPGAISFPTTSSKKFVLSITGQMDGELAEIKLSSAAYVEQFAEKTLAKMWPNPFPTWASYMWPVQPELSDPNFVVDPDKVLDISRYMKSDGTLEWQVPPGKWVVERIGMTPTQVQNTPASPEGTGLEADKMSKANIKVHFDAYLGEILKRIPAADRQTFKIVVQDSYETGGQNWTDGFAEQFQQVYHYNPVPYLPVMQGKVVGTRDQSDRFLWDLRRLIADNVAYKFIGGLKEVSHQHGLTTWLENYGHWGFPGEFLQYGGQSDEIGGEFWNEDNLGNIENKAASSAAHIYGKNRVSSESFTAGEQTYVRYPARLKKRGDRFFTEGINNTLLHVYIQQPDEERSPGINTNFGTEFNRKNTWFGDMDIFLKYIKRTNLMLQQGMYVADVAYFIGEDAPKMTGVEDPKLPRGYSFDYINAEVIESRVTVKDGKIVLPDGMSYRMLVLPKQTTMRPELLIKLKQLIDEGAVVLGPKPETSPSLTNFPLADVQVKALANEIWGNVRDGIAEQHQYGKGKVFVNMNMTEALEAINLPPDFEIMQTGMESKNILFTHRKLPLGEIYFISNQEDTEVNFSASFRVSGFSPQLWNPVDGRVRDLPEFATNDKQTTITLKLAPAESTFIIFRKKNQLEKIHLKENFPLPRLTNTITTPWQVKFDTEKRGPQKPVKFDKLKDWKDNPNDSIKYYSGHALYRNQVILARPRKGEKVFLNLGMVTAIAKVSVNGIDVGGVWTPPYKIDVTKAVRSGNNQLDIKVVNTWVNRLIGDSKLPLADRKTWLNYNPYKPSSPLQSSGLLGPVSFEFVPN